jgi:hypothetical protein
MEGTNAMLMVLLRVIQVLQVVVVFLGITVQSWSTALLHL